MRQTTIGDVIDVLTARREQATDPAERRALDRALGEIEGYVFRAGRLARLIGMVERVIAWRQKEATR